MPLDATNLYPSGPVRSADIKQYYDLFTGLMTDQPTTFRNAVSIGGNQSITTVPLKLFGTAGQTTNLIDLYPDRTSIQPGFGFSSVGRMAWGPGGAAEQDTLLSRIGTQNGHATDTAGLLIQPRLDIPGALSVGGQTNIGGSVVIQGGLTVVNNPAVPGGGGTVNIPMPDPMSVNRINVGPGGAFITYWAGDATYLHLSKLTVTPGPTSLAGLTVNGSETVNGNLGVTGASTAGAYLYSGGHIQAAGRGIFNGYDAGASWGVNVGGNGIASGFWYQRANGGIRCWDNADFTFSVGVVGNTLVQRHGSGYIYTNYLNMTADVAGGSPAYVAGQNGDGFLRWYPPANVGGGRAPPSYVWSSRLTAGVGGNPSSQAVSLPWNGYYVASAVTRGGEFSGEWQLECRMIVGSNQYWENYGTDAKPGHPQWDDSYVRVFMPPTYYNAGTAAYFTTRGSYGYDPPNGDNNSVMYIIFIPTAANPGG